MNIAGFEFGCLIDVRINGRSHFKLGYWWVLGNLSNCLNQSAVDHTRRGWWSWTDGTFCDWRPYECLSTSWVPVHSNQDICLTTSSCLVAILDQQSWWRNSWRDELWPIWSTDAGLSQNWDLLRNRRSQLCAIQWSDHWARWTNRCSICGTMDLASYKIRNQHQGDFWSHEWAPWVGCANLGQ